MDRAGEYGEGERGTGRESTGNERAKIGMYSIESDGTDRESTENERESTGRERQKTEGEATENIIITNLLRGKGQRGWERRVRRMRGKNHERETHTLISRLKRSIFFILISSSKP